MRAARLYGPGDLRIVDLPIPAPAAGQALVRVVTYSPYGTDVGVFLNRGGRYVSAYPVGVGADFCGVVKAVGEGVANVAIGDRVSALSLDHCGTCANCAAGVTNLCLDPAFALPPRQHCCEEYIVIPANKLAVLPPEVSFESGAMLAGLVDALNAYETMGVQAGETVAVIGVGAMGQGAIACARALGIEVVALGGTGKRVELVKALGARAVVGIENHGDDASARALALRPPGYDYVVETTASAWGLEQAFRIPAAAGWVAVTGGGPLPISAWDLVNKELRVVGMRAGHHQEQALALIAEGRIDLTSSITARFDLADAAEAFALLSGDRAADQGRVIVSVTAP